MEKISQTNLNRKYNGIQGLIEASKKFNPDEKGIKERNDARIEFVKQFPLEMLPEMTLEDYSLGNDNKNSFSYQLEFGNAIFGIGGGSAWKFGIFKNQKNRKYCIKKKVFETDSEAESEFNQIKTSLIEALELTKRKEFKSFDKILTPMWPGVMLKILSVYYPDSFLHIAKKEIIIKCAKDLGIINQDKTKINRIFLNTEIKKYLDSIPEFSGWDSFKLGVFIMNYYNDSTSIDNDNKEDGKMNGSRINKIKPLNVILYGPPGTGKTYNTKRKALEIILGRKVQDEEIKELFEQHKEQIDFITFHQSYAYEQFIEGIAVETNKTGNAIYSVKDGVFKNACNLAVTLAVRDNDLLDEASEENSVTIQEYLIDPLYRLNKKRKNEDNTIEPSDFDNAPPVVIIIDEINRGNISKIFGELITLIEDDKRFGEDNELIVTSGEQFGVPPNLYIIGTMNTADRSLVQLDTALRRRFEFEEMMPKYHQTDMFKGSLKNEELLNWENEGKIDHYEISYFLKKLNDKICQGYDRDHQIGHSFLMKVEDIKQLQRAWENKIMPLLQEYFYSDYEKLSEVIGTSEYLCKSKEKNNDNWELNMRVKDFDSQFKLVYDSVCSEA